MTSAGGENEPDAGAPPQKGFAYPQEELARMPDAPRISGTITVEGYTGGVLQIDVTLPVEGETSSSRGVPPITVFRQNTPGPYELYLPPGTEAVNLSLILDIKGNGPDAEDPKLIYEQNPITIAEPVVSGIDMVIDSAAAALPPAGDGAQPPAEPGKPMAEPSPPVPVQDALSLTQGVGEPATGNTAQDAPPGSPDMPGRHAAPDTPAPRAGNEPPAQPRETASPDASSRAEAAPPPSGNDAGASGRSTPSQAGEEKAEPGESAGAVAPSPAAAIPAAIGSPAPLSGEESGVGKEAGGGPTEHSQDEKQAVPEREPTPDPLDESLDTEPQ